MIPRIVKEDELVAANSAVWLSDSLADVLGYPLAAVFVAFLGSVARRRLLGGRGDLPRVGRARS